MTAHDLRQPVQPITKAALETTTWIRKEIAAIADELSVFDDWMERYQHIIDMGRKLPPYPDAWADDAHRVPGCQSKVWMQSTLRDGDLLNRLNGKCYLSTAKAWDELVSIHAHHEVSI